MKWRLFLFLLALAGCEMLGTKSENPGELRIAFSGDHNEFTRAGTQIPDTSEFIITITDSKGNVEFHGQYGDCPESITLNPDTYYIKAVSTEFEKPTFSAPQYGDEQYVVVPEGEAVDVSLLCRQLNSGVKLNISKDFLTECPNGVLFLKSDQGKLMYGYSEKRIAYFLPGQVSLLLNTNGREETLLTRTLLAQEVLSLKVNVASSKDTETSDRSGRVSISVDTLRNWITDTYVIGGVNGNGDNGSEAMTVQQARSSAGSKEVWVCGYVVGGDLTSASASFDTPFSARTNLLLGPKASTVNRDACLSVQLSSGEARDALNLVDNPQILGRRIYLRGDIVDAYFGLPGIKNISEYKLP